VAVEAGPDPAVPFTVAAVDDGDAGAAVEPGEDDDDDASTGTGDDVVDAPACPPAEFTPVAFPPCEQAVGTARASTTPSTVTMRRVIDGHHRPRARCS
jgi:hypothetical protein